MQSKILCHINGHPIYCHFIQTFPCNYQLRSRARALRKRGNLPEVIFWTHVNKKKFHSIDFDRQRIIGNYIVDFYCKALGLVVEIDGSSHNDREIYDNKREHYLHSLNLHIFRIPAPRISCDLENVLKELTQFILQHYSPPPEGARRAGWFSAK